MSKIVIVYGSGASHDSGLKIGYPGKAGGICYYPPPMDKGFFNHAGVKLVYENENEYYAIKKFREWLLPLRNDISLEELWTAVDLNHKHVVLNTYAWSEENERYRTECLIHGKSSYPFSDVISTTLVTGEAGNFGVMGMEPIYNGYKFLGDCGRDLKRLVDRTLSELYLADKSETNYELLHKKIVSKDHSIGGYITFNYDLALEEAIKKLSLKPRYLGVNDDVDNPYFISSFMGGSLVLKLHGSLSWKIASGCNDIEFYGHPIGPSYPRNSVEANSFIEPAIVPPTIFKQEINDDTRSGHPLTRLLINQWRGAIRLLSEADKIIIIGYSFPLTDFHSHRIFQIPSMIRRNKRVEQKVLVCSGHELTVDDEAKKKKLISDFLQVNVESIDITYKFSELVASSKLDEFLK